MKSIASLVLLSSLGLALPIYENTLKGPRTIERLDHLKNDVTRPGTEQLILSQGHASWQLEDMEPESNLPSGSEHPRPRPSFQEYEQDRQDQELAFIRSNGKEFNLPVRVTKSYTTPKQAELGPLELSKSSQPKTSSYGVFLGKWLPFKKPYSTSHCHHNHNDHETNSISNSSSEQSDSHTLAYLKPLDVLDVMESYGPECVGSSHLRPCSNRILCS
ncbi:hypothetical protein N7493_001608 [Penicillium malachiteum]|uniref:Uncharacterized protein n=1 Tax=Penicillium malachiteum TaxID=1324776 RepID=A0AAD6N049_9EURO|nr:hypothetical protein N7493_001608 [Penicillium malachiteum]